MNGTQSCLALPPCPYSLELTKSHNSNTHRATRDEPLLVFAPFKAGERSLGGGHSDVDVAVVTTDEDAPE